jgi:hypothetical protein
MKTAFHKKLISLCRVTRGPDPHWILVGSRTVRVPHTKEVVTAKRAIFASFVAAIPAGMEVETTCGAHLCVRPEHMSLVDFGRDSRLLDLQDQLDALVSKEINWGGQRPVLLPKGVTLQKVTMVKHLSRSGSTLASIGANVGIGAADVGKIRAGAYDQAVRNLERAVGARARSQSSAANDSTISRSSKQRESATPWPSSTAEVPLPVEEVAVEDVAVDDPSSLIEEVGEDSLSEDEAAWLKQVGGR